MLNISIGSGKYVIAVSGGVDSVVLLDLLSKRADLELIVVHLDHGIRPESESDEWFVAGLATHYKCDYYSKRVELGGLASEQLAREARYDYLREIRALTGAAAIITGHHYDDVLETAVINLVRGTGRRGITSLKSTEEIIRPLLGMTKKDILGYANQHGLQWREDSTNTDARYLRNRVRLELLPRLHPEQKHALEQLIAKLKDLNTQIDQNLQEYLTHKSHKWERTIYSRSWFNALPHRFACEIVHYWFAENRLHEYDEKLVNYTTVKLKTLRPGKKVILSSTSYIDLTKRSIRLHI
ncbi:MAG: tRNA lysidine(34) synthetase TilS [Patescibacteria group bacterium]